MLSDEQLSALRRLMELRDAKDAQEVAAKEAAKEYREAEAELFEELNGPISRLSNVDLGPPWGKVSFQRRETIYGRIIKGMEADARKHFVEQGMADVLSTPKFSSKRLNEIAREIIDSGGGEFPEGMDWYASRGVTITREKT